MKKNLLLCFRHRFYTQILICDLVSSFNKDYYRESVLLQMNQWGSKYYRIYAMVITNKGTLDTATDVRWTKKNDLASDISVTGKYENIDTSNKPTISLIGEIRSDEIKTQKNFEFKNVNVHTGFNQIYTSHVTIDNSVLTFNSLSSRVTKIEIGKTKVRISSKDLSHISETSYIVDVPSTSSVEIENTLTGNHCFDVINGINGIENEDSSNIKVKIVAKTKNTNVNIKGDFISENGKLLTLQTDSDVSGTTVYTSKNNHEMFTIEGNSPTFKYDQDAPSHTPFPDPTLKPVNIDKGSVYRESVLFQMYQWGSKYYRIPAMVITNKGTLVTATDVRWTKKNDLASDISVTIRRSVDGGISWDSTHIISGPLRQVGDGDPALVVDRKTNTIICLWNGDVAWVSGTAQNPEHLYYTRSFDDGITWEEKTDFTHMVYSSLCTTCDEDKATWASLFITSGAALQLRDGRIMVAGVVRCHGQVRSYPVFTDDIGVTWKAGDNYGSNGADESKYIERNDGVIINSIRHAPYRTFAFSGDRGATWTNITDMAGILKDSPCNGEIMRYTSVIDGYDKDRMLHTTVSTSGVPRINLTLYISYDEGKTWPINKPVRDSKDLGSYSSIAIGHDGLIHIYYEKGLDFKDYDDFNMTCLTVSLEWLTEGKDHYKKAEDLKWCICDKTDSTCTSQCPKEYHILSSKVFDNYIDTYFEYPTSMRYVFPKSIQDFSINLSIPGLQTGKYENIDTSNKPKVSIIGQTRVDERYYPKSFEFKNVNVFASADNIRTHRYTLVDSTLSIVQSIGESLSSSSVFKVEVGKSKVRVSSSTPLATSSSSLLNELADLNSYSTLIPLSESTSSIEISNIKTGSSYLEVVNGISGIEGEESAAVNVKIVASVKNTNIHIAGEWSADAGKKIAITTTADNSGTTVKTDPTNNGKFETEGESPKYDYVQEISTTTEEITSSATESITTTTSDPTTTTTSTTTTTTTSSTTSTTSNVPTTTSSTGLTTSSASDVEPVTTAEQTSATSNQDDAADGDGKKDSEGVSVTMIVGIIGGATAGVVIIAIIIGIVIVKRRKSNANKEEKSLYSDGETPLKSPLLF